MHIKLPTIVNHGNAYVYVSKFEVWVEKYVDRVGDGDSEWYQEVWDGGCRSGYVRENIEKWDWGGFCGKYKKITKYDFVECQKIQGSHVWRA